MNDLFCALITRFVTYLLNSIFTYYLFAFGRTIIIMNDVLSKQKYFSYVIPNNKYRQIILKFTNLPIIVLPSTERAFCWNGQEFKFESLVRVLFTDRPWRFTRCCYSTVNDSPLATSWGSRT